MSSINIFHILFVAPLLIYVGYKGANTNPAIFTAMMILGFIVILYHSYLIQNKKESLEVQGPGQIGYEPPAPANPWP